MFYVIVVASSTMEQPFASYQDNEKSYEKTTGYWLIPLVANC